MKPIILEMTAFGSYAQFTTVDFRKLQHCLYLITGDTGAGKTTIFDGIMFALYGVASGEGDKKFRTFEMMHCDYVNKSQDTVIRLEFEHIGKTYTVERKFHFRKKRGTEEFEKTTPQAKLWEPERDVLNGTDAVTARITELLGMNAEQFRKIVMLAQGEFKKFLEADSEDKSKILGELFDNSAYVWFQKIFDQAREMLSQRRREEGNDKIKRAMEDFILPENLVEEAKEIYTAGHSGLQEALEDLAKKDRARQETLVEQLNSCRESENKLRETLGKATEQNKKLEELTKKKNAFHDLLEKKPDMMRQKELADKVERALHKVMPKQALFQMAQEQYQKTEAAIQELSGKLDDLEKDKAEKEKLLDICKQENEPGIERLGNEIAQIEKSLPQYDDLKEKSKKQQEENKAAENIRRKKESVETNIDQTEKRIHELKKQIQELDGIDGTAKERQAALADAVKNLNTLTGKGGIEDQVDEIHHQDKELKKEQAALQKLLVKVRELEDSYHTIYQAFIEGQAGLLARNLEQELQEQKEAVCPVCRTAFHSSDPHNFAKFVEGTPEQKDVDRAKAAFEKKDKEREERSKEIAGQEAAIKGLKETVINRLRELKPDCPDWEGVDGTSYLEEVINEYEARKQKAQKEYNDAEKQRKALEQLKKERDEKEPQLKSYEESLKTYNEEEQDHKLNSEKLKAAIAELKKNLKYPDKEAAEAHKDELQKEKDRKSKEIKDAEKLYTNAEKEYNSVSGELKNNKDQLPDFQEEKERTERNLLAELEAQGFQSMKEVQALLKQAGEADSDVERWIRRKKKDIEHYENELQNTEIRINELEAENLERTDLDQLNNRIHELEDNHKEIQDKLDLCKKQYENHQRTAVTVREANQVLKETEDAWKRLDSLANLAVGVNSEGGKLSFDRYVMGYVFREVLDMANRRLDIMSGGRYELVHEMSAGRNNAKAGLEVAVFDMTTGKSRSASSLSGGESFFVSLALALGLSDVVQNHAGGKRLDALFIDEGFGTLDSDVLDHALTVLNQLTEGQRLVGIISHVAKLEESIPQQIQVTNSKDGSSLKVVH